MTWQVGSFSPLRIRSREGKVKFRFARRPAGRGLSKFFATTLHSVDPLGVVFAAGSDRGNYDVVWKTYRRRGVVSVPDQGDTLVVDDRSPAVEGELSLPRLAPCEQSQARIWLTAWADGQRVGRQEFADSLGEKRPTFSEELDERIAAALDSHGKVEISLAMKTSIGGVEKWIGESTRIILESDDGPRHSLSVVSIAANNRIVVDGSVTYSDDQAPFGGLVGLQRETSSGWQGISTMTCGDRGGFVFRERVDEVSAVSRFRVVAMDGGGIQAASGPFLAGSRGVNVRVRRAGVRTAKVRISVDAPSMVGTYRILMRDNDGAEVLNGFLKAGDQDVEIPYGSYDARLTVWRETVWSREGLVISGDSKVDIDLSSEIVCGEVEVLDSVTGERIGGASIRRTDGRPYWEEGGPGVVVVRSGDMPRVGDAFIRARGRMPMEPIEGAELPRICVSRADRLCEVAAPGYVSTQFELKTDRNVVRMARGRSHSLEVVCPVSLPISVRLDLEIVDRDVAPRYITEADQGDRRFTVFRAGGGKVSVMAFLVEKGKPTGSRKWRPLGRVECDLDDAKTQVRIPESALRGAIEALK